MNFCIICGETTQIVAYARLAPFILALSQKEKEIDFTQLNKCEYCGFSSFENRFNDILLNNLYNGYRGEKYLSVRHSWEPWYTSKTNAALLPDSIGVQRRIEFMESVARSHIDFSKLKLVADIGGDSGQFFPKSMKNATKYVIDVSSQLLQPGVLAAESLAGLPNKPDLIIGSHILEHLPDPSNFLEEIFEYLEQGGHAYLEIPLDSPKLRKFHASQKYLRYLKRISSDKKMWITFDFWTSICRQLGLKVPRYGAVKESEHINYFTPEAVKILMENNGFTVISLKETPSVKIGFMSLPVLGVLVRKT